MEAYWQTPHNELNIELKREFFAKKIASQNGDLKSAWKTVNAVLNKKSKTTQVTALEVDKSLISDSKSLAESMNKFFYSIGNTFRVKIPEISNPLLENEYSVNPQNLRFVFKTIKIGQLGKILGTYKNGTGADGIANHFFKVRLACTY